MWSRMCYVPIKMLNVYKMNYLFLNSLNAFPGRLRVIIVKTCDYGVIKFDNSINNTTGLQNVSFCFGDPGLMCF